MIAGLYVLAALAAFICARIEYLNAKADGKLPRREFRDGDSSHGLTKWRAMGPNTARLTWYRFHEVELREDGSLSRALSAEEQRDLGQFMGRMEANDRLRSCVETYGLVQYPLVIVLFFAALVMTIIVGRIGLRLICSVPLLIAVGCAAFMFHRAYFTSLGW